MSVAAQMPEDLDQASFRAALFDPQRAAPPGLTDGAGNSAGKRFDVYRNNVAVSLTEALHVGFPVIARLLGKENMDGVCGLFWRAHPPRDARLMHYGAAFPAFLEALPQLSHLGYLGDVARLECALRRSYHAADQIPIAPQELAEMPPERLVNCTATLAPALELLRSDWPIGAIWHRNMTPGAPKPQMCPECVLITRPDFDPQVTIIGAGAAQFLGALCARQTIGAAIDAASDDFDFAHTLGLLLQGAALISLTEKD